MPELLARIKPNPRKPQNRQYTVFGIRFQEARGWYRVDERVANHLRKVKVDAQVHGGDTAEMNEDAPDLFEVKTAEEAEAIVVAEARKQGKVLPADAPVMLPRDVTPASNVGPRGVDMSTGPDVTTKDLRPVRPPVAKKAAAQKSAAKPSTPPPATPSAPPPAMTKGGDEDDGEE